MSDLQEDNILPEEENSDLSELSEGYPEEEISEDLSEFSESFEADLLEMKEEQPVKKLDPLQFGNMKKEDLIDQCMKTKEFVPKYSEYNKTWFKNKKVAELKEILVEMTDSVNKEHNELKNPKHIDAKGKRIPGTQGELLFMVHQMLIVSAEGYAEMHKEKMKGVSIKGLSSDLEEHKDELAVILADNLEYFTGWDESDLEYFLTPPLKYAMFMLKIGNGRVIKNKVEDSIKKNMDGGN